MYALSLLLGFALSNDRHQNSFLLKIMPIGASEFEILVFDSSIMERFMIDGRQINSRHPNLAINAELTTRHEAISLSEKIAAEVFRMHSQAKMPPEADKALHVIQKQLNASLTAVYLHGSAAIDHLQPSSDVDVLAIIDRPMTAETRRRLVTELLAISGRYPFDPNGCRPLELIVFQLADLAGSHYPARSEFMYGEWLRHRFEAGETPEPVCNPELTLILAQARQFSKPLIGPAASELLPIIPQSQIHQAIEAALPILVDTLEDDERNVLLTLARMWRTLATGEFVTKDSAADWAATHLSAEHAAILIDARKSYLGINEEDGLDRQKAIRQTAYALQAHVRAYL